MGGVGKRIFLFVLMNIAIMSMVTIVTKVFGIEPYLSVNGINYKSLMIFCLLWGMGGSFISLLMSKFMAKHMMGVKIVDDQDQYRSLVQAVHRMSQVAGLPKMPEVGVYESDEVNAFATGPSKSNSLVAVSTGLLNTMSESERDGVLGHEVAHIANGDMVTMTLVQGVVNAFVLFFAKIVTFFISQAMRDDEGKGGLSFFAHIAVEIFFQFIFGFIGMFITSWFSRMREFSADIGGAKLAGRHNMISALKRLQAQYEHGVFEKEAQSGINAFKISSRASGLKAMLSTHPDLSERIRRLETSSI